MKINHYLNCLCIFLLFAAIVFRGLLFKWRISHSVASITTIWGAYSFKSCSSGSLNSSQDINVFFTILIMSYVVLTDISYLFAISSIVQYSTVISIISKKDTKAIQCVNFRWMSFFFMAINVLLIKFIQHREKGIPHNTQNSPKLFVC